MEIQTLEVDNINPAVYNPRKDLQPGDQEYDKLKKSILEFDMVEPLIWNKRTGNLVGGHQRLKILKELGIKHVEVSVVDLSEVKEKALNLALNKIQGEWDFPRLKDLVEELDTGEFDMEITGFDLTEIEDLMTQFHTPEEGLTDDDEIPEKVETICKTGELWQLSSHRLLCGDATKKEDIERLMGGEKADMVFTDPPYGISLNPKKNYASNKRRVLSEEYQPIIGDDGSLDIFALYLSIKCEIWYIWGADYLLPRLPNFNDGSLIVWAKRFTEFESDEVFGSAFELCWRIPKRKRVIWFERGINQSDEALSIHPTQKPTALAVRGIQDSSKMNDIILDLFGGSGSTLIACEKLGRRCYMMEIDEYYCDVIIQRWQNFTGKQAMRLD